MELILISNTKLKIMLDESDMIKYHIGSESDCAKGSTRRAIRSLLECARDQIGFNTDGEEIFVQLYTSKKGGCELFITKCLSETESGEIYERIKSPLLSDGTSKEHRSKKPLGLPEAAGEVAEDKPPKSVPRPSVPALAEKRSSRIAFSFDSLADLCKVCRILKGSDITPDSRAFADEDGRYYLLLLDTGMSAYSRLDRLTFIVEYGKRENPDCLVSYISEHGKIVCDEKAIETLAEF